MSLLIYGRNSVRAALAVGKATKLYVHKNFREQEILRVAKQHEIPCEFCETEKLNNLVRDSHHQGVVAECPDYHFSSLNDLIIHGKRSANPIVIMLDGIEDPHNLGAILRIADAFGVIGIIVKKNHQVALNATVAKVSTGAINYVKVAQVSNLNIAIKTLKDNGYWVVATDGDAKASYYSIKYDMPVVLVIGSEGNGISPLVKSNSDFIVKIPMYGHVNSLNASNALSVVLSHIVSSR